MIDFFIAFSSVKFLLCAAVFFHDSSTLWRYVNSCLLSVLLTEAESPGNWSPLFRPDGSVVTGHLRIAAAAWTAGQSLALILASRVPAPVVQVMTAFVARVRHHICSACSSWRRPRRSAPSPA